MKTKLILIAITALLVCGCQSIRDYAEGKLGNATGGTEYAKPVNADEVEYSLLQWDFGGFNGANAKLDTPRLSGASCNGRRYSYRWDVGLSGWGLGNDEAGAICAVFIERADGYRTNVIKGEK